MRLFVSSSFNKTRTESITRRSRTPESPLKRTKATTTIKTSTIVHHHSQPILVNSCSIIYIMISMILCMKPKSLIAFGGIPSQCYKRSSSSTTTSSTSRYLQLLGNKNVSPVVRYRGGGSGSFIGDKDRQRFLKQTLGSHVDWWVRKFSSTTTTSLKSVPDSSIASAEDTIIKDDLLKNNGGTSVLSSEIPSSLRTDENNKNNNSNVHDDTSKTTTSSTTNTQTKVTILADHADFIVPERDPRQYRAIQLGNNLRVLLVSDQMTPGTIGVEAASVHVQAGHFDDTIPGLAHFHEHMLFLGTKKYPEEDDYENFLSQYGGFSNAYTDMEDTNYYFSVTTEVPQVVGTGDDVTSDDSTSHNGTSDALYGGLDRLAQFFIAPTFDRDAVDRELKAIDSEYRNGKTSDSWRNYQLLKSLANPLHPFNKFGCGNYETLSQKGIDQLLDELHKFWKDYYQTYNLRLAVVGHSSLDSLQQTVVETFGQLAQSDGTLRRVRDNDDQTFPREATVYGVDAFDKESRLGRIRKVIPFTETRVVKVYFKTPPVEDPVLRKSKPYAVVSHVLGHEAPGSLHAVLNEQGFINSLSSGMAVDTADFSLFQIAISLTPKGLQNKDEVLDLLFQWIALVRDNENMMSQYHDELTQIQDVNFRFRENGDPTDFCSTAAELLFDESNDPARILRISAEKTPYDPVVAKEFLNRLRPDNAMISIVSSDLNANDGGEWMTEPWYGAQYQEDIIPSELINAWDQPKSIDHRLRLPDLNQYIPSDFSLRCNDPVTGTLDTEIDTAELDDVDVVPPNLIVDNESIRLWHKMDQYWRVPKTFVKAALLSPSIYSSPRVMTLNRLFQRMLNDDLNSYVYDASLAGCNYRVSCTPQGYRLSVRGYSEKIPFLLDTLTTRMLSLIEEMKVGDSVLQAKFEKEVEGLLRETKNYRLDPPYEVASYNARLLIEESVWYLDNYVDVMEGKESLRHPLTMLDCAKAAEECLTGSIKCEALCMGNIDEKEAQKVNDVLDRHFLKDSRLLNEVEVPRFRSMMLPTRDEAVRIFGPEVQKRSIPLVYQEIAYTTTEENSAVEIILQAGSEFELGYEGLAIFDLITHMAYNSAFSQLRTKEQLGYIVSAHGRRTAGGGWGMSLVIQSSVALPDVLEERCEAWLEIFRKELEEMTPDSIAREASSVVSQLLENDTKLSQEVSRAWGEILNTEGLVDRLRTPAFDRLQKLAQELTPMDDDDDIDVDENEDGIITPSTNPRTTPGQLKTRVLEFFDQYFALNAPKRRTMSSRVYSRASAEAYEANLNQPGILSNFSDMRYVKQFLGSYPNVPYWRIEKTTTTETTPIR